MIVLGCDPGAVTGLCVLDCHLSTPIVEARYAADGDGLSAVVREFCRIYAPDVLAIELPSQVFTHGRAKGDMAARIGIERSLLAARGIAGTVRGIVETLCPGARVFEAQAHDVRRAVLGRLPRAPKGKDARTWIDGIVRQRMPLLVAGWEKGTGDNNHNRDACVAAVWGSRRARMPDAMAKPRRTK